MSCISNYTIKNIINNRNRFNEKTKQQQLQFLIDVLDNAYNKETEELHLYIEGQKVCRSTFIEFFDMSCYQYYTALERVKEDKDKIVVHGNYLRSYKDNLSRLCRTFLQNYSDKYCEIQPNNDI